MNRNTATTTTTTSSNDNISTTRSSLQLALIANQQLQEQLTNELSKLLERKERNRNTALRCLQGLSSSLLQQEQEERQRQEEENDIKNNNEPPREADIAALSNNSTNDKTNNKSDNTDTTRSIKRRRLFRYDPNRRWKLDFWLDPTGSRPSDNEDTKRRQTLWENQQQKQQTKQQDSPPPPPPAATPFSKQESNLILQNVNQQQQKQPDWYAIASLIEENRRTPLECLNHYYKVQTKMAREKNKSSTTTATQNSNATTTTAASSSLSSSSSVMVDRNLQQETLFRYLALQGPQFVVDLNASSQIVDLIGKGRYTHKQMLAKANSTRLMNPNMLGKSAVNSNNNNDDDNIRYNRWSMDEQRKLVLAIKMYTTTNRSDNNNNNYNNTYFGPVQMAAMHFPTRPTSYVTKKWDTSLDPNSVNNKKNKKR